MTRGDMRGARRFEALDRTGLHLVVAGWCTAVGALMLVVPHQFELTPYDALRPALPGWGFLQLLAGTMLTIAAVIPRRWLILAGHGLAAVCLLGLAASLVAAGSWYVAWTYASFGLGIGLAPFWRPAPAAGRPPADLLSLVAGLGICATGLSVFAAFESASASYAGVRPLLILRGAGGAVFGLVLAGAQLARPGRRGYLACQLVGAAVLGYVALGSALALRAWPAALLYGGSAIGVASFPWADRLGRYLDGGSLRTRLALTLALITGVPLIVGTGATGEAREVAAVDYAERLYHIQAETLAAYVREYVGRQQAAVAGLTTRPGFLALPPVEQERQLRALNAVNPGVTAFATFDQDNRPLARSDGLPPTPARDPLVSDTRERGSAIFITISVLHRTQVFAFGAAFHDGDGRYLGMATVIVENARIAEVLARQGEEQGWRAYLTDGAGRAIAHPDPSFVADFADLSSEPPLVALRAGSGSIRYPAGSGGWLAGVARVPDLGWAVVVERPANAALAEVHAEREALFAILTVVLLLAAIVGWLVAGWLAAPLQSLGRALAAIAAGGPRVDLPRSTVHEVQRVADLFDAMRERLAVRTLERDRVEQQLRDLNAALESRVVERTADLQAAVRAREEFLSIASHELRNPLAVLRGVTQLLQRMLDRGQLDTDRLRRYLATQEQTSARLAGLIEDLLDVSRLQTGQLPLRVQPTDLCTLVREAVAQQQARAEGYRFEIDVLAEPCIAKIDPARLDQVIANLLDNAVKYSPEARRIEISLAHDRDGLLLCVRDHGIGIPPAALEQIFEPFGRAPNAAEQHIPGMGLGLHICRGIVEQHGGRIWAESGGEGQGSSFSVWLPAL